MRAGFEQFKKYHEEGNLLVRCCTDENHLQQFTDRSEKPSRCCFRRDLTTYAEGEDFQAGLATTPQVCSNLRTKALLGAFVRTCLGVKKFSSLVRLTEHSQLSNRCRNRSYELVRANRVEIDRVTNQKVNPRILARHTILSRNRKSTDGHEVKCQTSSGTMENSQVAIRTEVGKFTNTFRDRTRNQVVVEI